MIEEVAGVESAEQVAATGASCNLGSVVFDTRRCGCQGFDLAKGNVVVPSKLFTYTALLVWKQRGHSFTQGHPQHSGGHGCFDSSQTFSSCSPPPITVETHDYAQSREEAWIMLVAMYPAQFARVAVRSPYVITGDWYHQPPFSKQQTASLIFAPSPSEDFLSL